MQLTAVFEQVPEGFIAFVVQGICKDLEVQPLE